MKLNTLKPTPGSNQKPYRAARGMAQGRGKQAGKGQSGQNKRGGTRPGFEGGQNPLYRRLPKIGFENFTRVDYQIVSLSDLNTRFKANDVVDETSLRHANLIARKMPIKVLAKGKLDKKLTIKVHAISKTALEQIKQSGGTVEILPYFRAGVAEGANTPTKPAKA